MADKINITQRKGKLYIEIKIKNKYGRYLYDPAVEIDVYKEYLKRRNTKRQVSLNELKKGFKGSKVKPKIKRAVTRYRKKHKYIEPNIKGGIAKIMLKDVDNYRRTQILQAKTKLMSELVLDKDLLKLLITEENFKKIKHRLDYIIETKDHNGEVITRTFKHGMTPEEIIQRIKQAKIKGILEEYGTIRNKLSLNGIANTKNLKDTGVVNRTDLTVSFRKR